LVRLLSFGLRQRAELCWLRDRPPADLAYYPGLKPGFFMRRKKMVSVHIIVLSLERQALGPYVRQAVIK
jgi:hypothetical protein